LLLRAIAFIVTSEQAQQQIIKIKQNRQEQTNYSTFSTSTTTGGACKEDGEVSCMPAPVIWAT
jgi:hypothetical protein